jgi:hypothetical protein
VRRSESTRRRRMCAPLLLMLCAAGPLRTRAKLRLPPPPRRRSSAATRWRARSGSSMTRCAPPGGKLVSGPGSPEAEPLGDPNHPLGRAAPRYARRLRRPALLWGCVRCPTRHTTWTSSRWAGRRAMEAGTSNLDMYGQHTVCMLFDDCEGELGRLHTRTDLAAGARGAGCHRTSARRYRDAPPDLAPPTPRPPPPPAAARPS